MKLIFPLNAVLATALALGAVAEEPASVFQNQPLTLQPNALATGLQFGRVVPFQNAPVTLQFAPAAPGAKIRGTVVLSDPVNPTRALPAPGLYLSYPGSMIVGVPRPVEQGMMMSGRAVSRAAEKGIDTRMAIEKPAILVPLRR